MDAAAANAPIHVDCMTQTLRPHPDKAGQSLSECNRTELDHSDSEASTSSEREPCAQLSPTPARSVYFADAFPGCQLAVVIEVESLKEHARFTSQERRQADSEWRHELLQLFRTVSAVSVATVRDGLALRQAAVERVLGSCLELALADEEIGSIVVQEALVAASLLERVAIVGELRGNVARLLCSMHGSHVLLACLRILPKATGFVAQELAGRSLYCIRDSSALSVLCGALRHLPAAQTLPLVEEILNDLEAILEGAASDVVDCLLARGNLAEQEKMVVILRDRSQGMCVRAQSVLAHILDRFP